MSQVATVEDVSVMFGDRCAVERVSFHVGKGERIALLGSTGAGKSTLLNLLVGAVAPTSGTVRVVGKDPYREARQLKGQFAIAFQTARLLPWKTAQQNVAVGLRILGSGRADAAARAERWLRKVGLGDALSLFPAQMSGGMRQRVSLARAFAVEPSIIFLDEAFSALDEVTSDSLRKEFVALSDETDVSALIVTHSIEEAFELAHRILVIGRPAHIVGEFHHADFADASAEQRATIRAEIHRLMRDGEPGGGAPDGPPAA